MWQDHSSAEVLYDGVCYKPECLVSSGFGAEKKSAAILLKLRWTYGRSDRIRTCGILLPKQARYQLRYTPIFYFAFFFSLFTKRQTHTTTKTAVAAISTGHTGSGQTLALISFSPW